MSDRSPHENREAAGSPLTDGQLDALLRTALDGRCMPDGLADATLAFIHERSGEATPDGSADMPVDPSGNQKARTAESIEAPLPLARRRMPRRRFVQLMAACLATGALAAGGVGAALADETAQVQVDGSATVELGLNRWNRVVRTWSSDDVLAAAVDALGLVRLPCSEALELLAASGDVMDELARDGHVGLFASSDSEDRASSALAACAESAACFGAGTTCAAVDAQTRSDARDAGMGVSRYLVYLEIAQLDPTVALDDCRALSMRELRALRAELAGDSDEDATGPGNGTGSGKGSGQGRGAGGQGAGQGQSRGSMGAGSGPSDAPTS